MSPAKRSTLQLVTPPFDSPLTDDIVELEKLRKKYIVRSTPSDIFFQIKNIFHLLESWASARIEGNYTTVLELVDLRSSNNPPDNDERFREILNLEEALDFIDEEIGDENISHLFIRELHKQVVNSLTAEGDPSPGLYRRQNVSIAKSKHQPVDYTLIQDYMDELVAFINKDVSPKYGLIKIALAHHRFTWIHPFANGNGRTARLLTYAMLIKQKFDIKKGGRILNPTAVFCSDRKQYYNHLSIADSGKHNDLLKWCAYVAKGLKNEMMKIDNLLDDKILKENVLTPAIDLCRQQKAITSEEASILKMALNAIPLMAKDVKSKFDRKSQSQISHLFRSLKDKGMLKPETPDSRKYYIHFIGNDLLRFVVKKLDEHKFLPLPLE